MVITNTSTVQLSYYSDRIIVSKESLINGSAVHKKKEIMLQNRSTIYNGFLSPSAKRRVRTILTTWFNAMEHNNSRNDISLKKSERKLVFVTLTLSESQKHEDNWIKRNMLDRFLVKMKRMYNVKYYFWRAEKQKNGRIHFHVIFDHYVRKEDIQSEWNSIQQDTGYMDEYFAKNKRYNAPSTHIRAISDAKNSIDYVMKYVAKVPDDIEDVSLQVKGRIWGCSKELKELKPYSTGEISGIGADLNYMAETKQVKLIDSDHFQIYYLDVDKFLKRYHSRVFDDLSGYYRRVYERLYKLSNFEKAISQHIDDVREKGGVKAVQLSLFAEMYLDDDGAKRKRNRENH